MSVCVCARARARAHTYRQAQRQMSTVVGRVLLLSNFFKTFLLYPFFSEILSLASSPLLVNGGKVGMDGYAVV